ncbi:MAG: UDP-N-acetylglucosamine acyltransferase [Longispora sp.]|nr:UDP-N-acetylglucosamine acyltransferase [Longispora sp. (in: high G+C Gram-positive bacteria)]
MPNRIHPSAIIGPGVELGNDNVIGPFTVIGGPCQIGNGNWIGPMVSIGTPAEYRGGPHPVGWEGEIEGGGVVIGNRNTIRESVTVNQGLHDPTRMGDDCYLLARSHLGHDVVVDDGVTLSDSAQIGGHTHVWSWVNVGLGAVVHQRGQLGPGAMIGMGAVVLKEVAPFRTVVGNPSRVVRVNRVGLSRQGCDGAQVDVLEHYLEHGGDLPAGLPPEMTKQLTAWQKRTGVEI